jgi:hypothetical protein
MRRWFTRATALALFLAAVEGIFFGFGLLSMQRGNPYLLYAPWRISSAAADLLPTEREASVTGWPRRDEFPTRTHPEVSDKPCGSAWGGSFTRTFDVADAEAWPHLISVGLGCQIDNHGVDGFGLDQTLLQFRQHAPSQSIIILGLSEPMIIADGLSSWTFVSLGQDKEPKISPTKPRFVLDGDRLSLIPRPAPDIDAITRYLTEDMATTDWTSFAFPFSYHVASAIYRKQRREIQFNAASAAADREDMAKLRGLGSALITEMAREATARHNHFVLLLIPSTDFHGALGATLTQFASAAPGICVVDPSSELTEADAAGLRSPSGHFSAAGNQALAAATLRGLKACGITT